MNGALPALLTDRPGSLSSGAGPVIPALITAAGNQAATRILEVFASTLRNPHTRRGYARAVGDFLNWCDGHRVSSIAGVQPLHVAAWIEGQTREHSAPTVKQQLAAIRHLFDWLVVGQVVPLNPAASVRGPAHSVRKGKTPVLDAAEARILLDSINVTTPIGLRDRALIALMVYSFGRIGAALAMRVEDVFVENRRLWVRLREKGGKRHEMPCHHSLEETCTPTWTAPGSPTTRKDRCSGRSAAAPAGSPARPCRRPTPTPWCGAGLGGGDRHKDRQS